MGYRARKARFDAGEMTFLDVFGLGLASAIGIVVATFLDLTQAAEASSLFVINKWVSSFTMLVGLGNLPLYVVLLLLMVVGAFAVIFFQPVTLRGAFVQGFGLLAILTTVAPSDLGLSLPGLPTDDDIPADTATLNEVSFGGNDRLRHNANFTQAPAVPGYTLRVQIELPNSLPNGKSASQMIEGGSLRGKLYNETTGETYNLFRNSGAAVEVRDNMMSISTRIPGDAPSTTFVARVEVASYRIVESRFDANLGQNPQWTIKMQPSRTPLLLQRLRRPYWF